MPSFSSTRSLIRSIVSVGSISISISLPVKVLTLIYIHENMSIKSYHGFRRLQKYFKDTFGTSWAEILPSSLLAGAGLSATCFLSGCCSLPRYVHPPAVCQQRSDAAGQGGFLKEEDERCGHTYRLKKGSYLIQILHATVSYLIVPV